MLKVIAKTFFIAALIVLFIHTSCRKDPVTTINSFDEVPVKFENTGSGDLTVILIHGWTNNRTIWEGQVGHFSEKYQVIAVDLPGFGESGNSRKEWTMVNFGKDISAIIEKLGLENVVLVGFSMGGPVALEAAVLQSKNVKGVVLVDNTQQIEMKIPPPMVHVMDSMMMDMITNVSKEKLIAGGFFKHNTDEAYNKVLSMLDTDERVGWHESLTDIFKWTNERCISTVTKVESPIIAINSDMQATNIEAWKKYDSDFKVRIVKDAGHVIMWDKPDEFNQLLEECIREFTTN